MTDINELTAKLKASALKASGGDWIKESGDGWDAICSSDDQANGGFIVAHFEGPDAAANREFAQTANPANIVALTEALEAAEKRNAELQDELFEANARVDIKCAELCKQDEIIEGLHLEVSELKCATEKRIAELRDWNAGLAQESFDCQQRIAELEARTLTVRLPHWSGYTCSGEGAMLDACVRSLESQGFTVQIEGE